MIRNIARPLIESVPNTKWLTVGDGSFGSDANYLIRNGLDAHASDMFPVLLEKGSELGFIKDYSKQNAESLTFSSNSFDYVFVKDALHHCPRPILALYEMLRVARHAIVLLEPVDERRSLVHRILRLILRRKFDRYTDNFEEVGNYIYKFSERELTKICLGLGLSACSFKRFNTYYFRGMEFVPSSGGTYKDACSRIKYYYGLKRRNIFSAMALVKHDMMCSILFKTERPDVYAKLRREGFRIVCLPCNPFSQGGK